MLATCVNSIFCDICHCWVHQKTSSGLKISQLSLPNSETWFCPKCVNKQYIHNSHSLCSLILIHGFTVVRLRMRSEK